MPEPTDPRAAQIRAVYVISVAAELAGVHPQTLRIYERKGLLDPARTRGGSRRYSEADIDQLRRIQELTNEGLNLAGVKRVLALEARVAELEAELAGSAPRPPTPWPPPTARTAATSCPCTRRSPSTTTPPPSSAASPASSRPSVLVAGHGFTTRRTSVGGNQS